MSAVPAPAARARTAVAVVFAVNGLIFASWLSRTPAIRDALGLSELTLGLLLLCLSAGAVVGLPLAGPLVQRFGTRSVVQAGALVAAGGLTALAAGVAAGAAGPAGAGLVACGLGLGVWDVAMNVEGAAVEQQLGRALMPRLHAAFSLGTVAGALLGAGASAIKLPLPAQLVGTAAAAVVLVVAAVRCFPAQAPTPVDKPASAFTAWREPRTLLIGVLVLAFAFAEGSANDWIAVALVDGHGAGEPVAALGFAVFVSAMMLGRLFGGAIVDRWGRSAALRAGAALAAAGVLLVVFGPATPVALVGALLWGAGAALGFPVGMSAAADDPAQAAARVGVVSAIGYTAFIAGPPLIGLLAEANGILRSLLVVLTALVVGLLAAGVAGRGRPAPPAPGRERSRWATSPG